MGDEAVCGVDAYGEHVTRHSALYGETGCDLGYLAYGTSTHSIGLHKSNLETARIAQKPRITKR